MSSEHYSSIDLLERIQEFVVDGECNELADDHWTDFEQLLRENDDACRAYAEYMGVSVLLRSVMDAMSDEESSSSNLFSPKHQEPIVPSTITLLPTTLHDPVGYFSSDWTVSYLIATVICGIGILISAFMYVSQPGQVAERLPGVTGNKLPSESQMEFVGRITDMVDCRLADESTAALHGAHVPLGRKYALRSGLMEITYDTGAKVILQGPVTYQVESKDGGYLAVGKLTARLEKNDKRETLNAKRSDSSSAFSIQHSAFFVRTPTAIVTDLGTEFGVEVSKKGDTLSHVFRGSVRLEVLTGDGRAEGVAQVLRENQSARVENDVRGGENRVIVIVPSAKSADFIRAIPKQQIKVLDLVDVVAGGDGFSGRRNAGIDPTNGRPITVPSRTGDWAFVGDGKYHRVEGLPFVDGVFIPDGRAGQVQLDSVGHTFDGFSKTDNMTSGYVWAGGEIPVPPALQGTIVVPTDPGGIDYASPGHGLIFLHANKGITFDLQAIRRANPNWKPVRFRAAAANAEVASLRQLQVSADVWVFIDGQVRFQRRGIRAFNGAILINIAITDNDRFLTLTAIDAGNSIACDWILFGDPQLYLLSAKAVAGSTPEPKEVQ